MLSQLQTFHDIDQPTTSNRNYEHIELLNSKLQEKFPIQIQQDKISTEGRYIKSVTFVSEGQEVFSGEPLSAVVFDQYKKRVCSYCFLPKPQTNATSEAPTLPLESLAKETDITQKVKSKEKKRTLKPGSGGHKKGFVPPIKEVRTPASDATLSLCCNGCGQVYFCSELCKNDFLSPRNNSEKAHSQTCRAYRRLATSKLGRHSKSVLKLVINILQICSYEQDKKIEPDSTNLSSRDELNLLQTHINNWSLQEKQQWNKGLSLFVGAASECNLFIPGNTESVKKNWLLGLISVIESNSFGIFSSDSQLVGRALLPLGSFFNHSCSPNAEVNQNGKTVHFRALKTIDFDTPITISYLDESLSIRSRRSHLLSEYHFNCNCEKCVAEGSHNKS